MNVEQVNKHINISLYMRQSISSIVTQHTCLNPFTALGHDFCTPMPADII